MIIILQTVRKSSYGQSGVSCDSYQSHIGSGRIGVTVK